MTDEEGFCGEGVRLYINVRAGNFVDERGFSDIGITADEKSTCVGIDGWQTGDVLADLLKVGQWIFLTSHDGSHTFFRER